MRKLLIMPMVMAACSTTPPEAPLDERDQEMTAILAMAYDPAQLRVGQRALYQVTREGRPTPRYVKLQVVAQEPGDLYWVELSLPVSARSMVVKSKLDRAGKLHEQWVGEPGGGPAQTFPRGDGRSAESRKPPADVRADVDVTDETVAAGGRQYLCKKVTTRLSYADGRSSTLVNWCHPDVPFSFKLGSDSLGGVVRRVYGKYTLELVHASQEGARAELAVPRR
ncbi:MAG: hypothetical protein HYY16_09520 [Planctomycetes bacterium]|nr:hypothetical protein [Planctomycetota bacterium]